MEGFVLLGTTLLRDKSFPQQLVAFSIKPRLSFLPGFLRRTELATKSFLDDGGREEIISHHCLWGPGALPRILFFSFFRELTIKSSFILLHVHSVLKLQKQGQGAETGKEF